MVVLQRLLAFVKKINQKNKNMKSIVNNTGSPFKLTFQSSRGGQGGAYENVPTTATYGSNEAMVEAISGIGKVAGGLIKQGRAKKELDKLSKTQAEVNKTTPKTVDKDEDTPRVITPTAEETEETEASEDSDDAIFYNPTTGVIRDKRKGTDERKISDIGF